eukprot:3650217-Ditylum_brightwellii.AAC.1
MEKFCLAMDNYFTVPSAMKYLRDKGIGVVGTARARRGWPPSALQKVEQKECDFDEFRYLIDNDGTLIAKWMVNGLVLLVSTLHAVGNSIKVNRRKPHTTLKNKGHVEK